MHAISPAEIAAADALIALALAEDFGSSGDCTSDATIPESARGEAAFAARTPGVLAGLPVALRVIERVSSQLQLEILTQDGDSLQADDRIAIIRGPMRPLLAAERTALNFLQRLSGVASLTRRYVDAVHGTRAKILDTRKTTPGWRLLEKYAVRMGRGVNHRIGLYDGFLAKDNHLAALRQAYGPEKMWTELDAVIERFREINPGISVEIEVDSLDQLELVLPIAPDIVLLDNMKPELLREAVRMRNEFDFGIQLEASGGVNLQTVRAIAETGVDRISVGALTHSAPALDIGLDYLE